MQLITTTPQRTYRYVRLSILGAVVVLTVSLVDVAVRIGPITSISATVYTPGRSIFVGALFAVSLALLALSGRSVAQVLLDLAALSAPLIAIVPTPVRAGDVPGLLPDCPDPLVPCVPAAEIPGIHNGVLSLVVLGVIGVIAALVLARQQRTLSVGVWVALGAASGVIGGVAVWWWAMPASLLQYGHLAATSTLFGIIAVVAAIAAITSTAPWRAWYTVVAVAIAADLALLVTVVVLRANGTDMGSQTGTPLVFVAESVALALFAAFWLLQTIQLWSDTNPSIIPPRVRRAGATG